MKKTASLAHISNTHVLFLWENHHTLHNIKKMNTQRLRVNKTNNFYCFNKDILRLNWHHSHSFQVHIAWCQLPWFMLWQQFYQLSGQMSTAKKSKLYLSNSFELTDPLKRGSPHVRESGLWEPPHQADSQRTNMPLKH